MSKVNDINFFRKTQPVKTNLEQTIQKGQEKEISSELKELLKNTIDVLTENRQKAEAEKIKKIYEDAVRELFSVAVVGEFSKGKSTFINTFLKKEFLPIGDMPTTSMITRIRYNPQETMILFDKSGKKVKNFPLSQESWEGLTAQNLTGNDYEGTMLAGVNSPILSKHNIELIDTPGAGDLEEKRAQLIGEALLGSDGAIITISATSALSMSEKLFIEQRLLSRKTPFLMLIVTKLDQIAIEERSDVVHYIIEKLKLWNMKIPVYISYDVKMPDDRFEQIMGMDKVQKELISWVHEPQRVKLTEVWIATRTLSVLEVLLSSMNEQKLLLDATNDEKRADLLREKSQKLSKAELAWDDIKLKMLERNNACYSLLLDKAEEYKVSITERLQYEVSHSNNPQKWWNDDYPYRLKIELANVSTAIENIVSKQIMEDARWFNAMLEKNFKTHVLFEKSTISDKELFLNSLGTKNLEFEDIAKQRTAARVATAVLSVAGSALCMSIGFFPIVATMGIGTGAGIVSEKIFKGKIEKQQEDIKAALAKVIPQIIDEAMSESERRLKAVYEDMINSASEKEQSWLDAQRSIIEKSSNNSIDRSQVENLAKQIEYLDVVKEKLEKYN